MDYLPKIILFITFICVFSATFYLIFLNKLKPFGKNLKWLIPSFIVILSFSFLLSIKVDNYSRKINYEKEQKNINDSINKVEVINQIDSIKKSFIISKIENYYKNSNEHRIDSLLTFFSDNIKRYFLLNNVTKNTVRWQCLWYWRKFPNDKFLYSQSDLDINFYGYDSCNVFIYGDMYKYKNIPIPVKVNMKFNKRAKIYYLRCFDEFGIDSTNMKIEIIEDSLFSIYEKQANLK